MERPIQRWLINLSLLLLSLSFSLGLPEILLRAYWSSERLGHHKLFNQYDPLLGWVHIPYGHGVHSTAEYQVSETFNSKGIRGPEYSYQKFEKTYRILILGDSFAEGYTVEFNELFSEVLARNLNGQGFRHFEVINTGTGGYSTDQELLLFQGEGRKYLPDLTILMFTANDVWFNNQPTYPRGYKPLFRVREGELVLSNVPVPPPELNRHSDQPRTPGTERSLLKVMKRWLSENSYLYEFVTTRIKNVSYLYALAIRVGLAEDTRGVSGGTTSEAVPIPDEFRVWEKQYSPEIRDAWKITEALIRKLKGVTMSVGSELVVFYVPIGAAVYRDEWQSAKRKYGITDDDWSIDRDAAELRSICERANIDFIDPIQVFKEEAERVEKKGRRLYFSKDGHWNADGHRLVGKILFNHVKLNYVR